jgi:Tfp pilus assembly protein PilV
VSYRTTESSRAAVRPTARRRLAIAAALTDQRGFTIIEVLVSGAVLLTGLLGVITMVDGANATGGTQRAREQGVALARELLENARSVPYSQLVPAAMVAKLQGMPGLANANAGSGWTIQRRGVTYGVAVGVCSIDDASDGYGTEDPNYACSNMAGAPSVPCAQLVGRTGSVAGDAQAVAQISNTLSRQKSVGACGLDPDLDGRVDNLTQADASACANSACQPATSGDSSPDDYKRLVALLTWSTKQGGSYVLESTVVVNPGMAAGPTISQFTLKSGFNNGSSTILNLDPSTNQAITSVPFTATSDSNTVSLQWTLNGTPQGSATNSGGTWSFNWPIGTTGSGSEVLDGNYTVGVVPFDSNGNAGTGRSMTVTLNRRVPYAPPNLVGGRNSSLVDLQWSPNKEGDIAGYHAYRIVGSGQPDVLVCSTKNATSNSCQDTSPPNASSIQYYVVAVDTSPSGSAREGDHSANLTVTNPPSTPPNAPQSLQASTSNGNTVLVLPTPSTADAAATAFYRIYRDGQAVANRYDTAPGGATTSYTDTQTGGVAHNYWVTAVNSQLGESAAVGPVTR